MDQFIVGQSQLVAQEGFIEMTANTLGWVTVLAIAAAGVAGIVSIVATFIITRGNLYKTFGAGIAAFVLAFIVSNFALGVAFTRDTVEELKTKPPVDAVDTGGIGN